MSGIAYPYQERFKADARHGGSRRVLHSIDEMGYQPQMFLT
jgi:hypothetical protein